MAKEPYVINIKKPEDSPKQLAEKLNTLNKIINLKVIDADLVSREEFDDFKKNSTDLITSAEDRVNYNIKNGRKTLSDQRWHGGGGGGSSSGGITSINSDTTATQNLAVGTTGTDFALVNNGTGTHTFNLPTASAINRGALSSTDWTTFNNKGAGTVTTVSVATANGFAGTVANATTTPAITVSTSVTGLLKGNGTAVSAAASGTDYAPATSGSAVLKGNGAGGFTNSKVALTEPATAATLTIVDNKTLTVNHSLTLAGTDSTTMTFPTTSATIARTDAANTFTGVQTTTQVLSTNNAIAASGNAATVPVTSKVNTVTNNSAATLTITLTTAGAVDRQTCIVCVLDFSAVAQTITWVNTENSTVNAPVTSNGSTTLPLTIGFMYNAATGKWRCIASA